MEFDSEVLVNQAPTLQLANGKTATFMTQYDTKTLLFSIAPENLGQKVTGLAAGAIESMHNLPVSVVGTKLTNGVNGDEAAIYEVPEFTGGVNGEEAAINEIPEFTGGVNGEEAAVAEVPEYTEPIATVGDEAAPTVELPEFTGGVNAVEAAVNEVPEFVGGVNAVEALKHEVPEFVGGVNSVLALKHELPEYVGGVNAVEAAINEVPEYKVEDQPLVTLVAQQDKTYQAPAAQPQQPALPETGSEVSTSLVSLGLVGMFLGLFGMAKKKED